MHTVTPETVSSEYKIVQCQDPLCNICTSTAFDGYGIPPSLPSQGIVVYTCSNPSCSLCDGDYSLLLDIINPTISPQDDWVLVQEQMRTQMTSQSKRNKMDQETTINLESTTRRPKRKLSGPLGHTAKLRRQSTVATRNTSDDIINSIDDNQLMNLEMELELDKKHCLPDLQKDVIAAFAI